jgi:hypothetical protein
MENHGGIISTGELRIPTPELSGNPTSSRLLAKQEELGEVNYGSGLLKYLYSYFARIFNMP